MNLQHISRQALGRRIDAEGNLPMIHDGDGKRANGSLDRVEKVYVLQGPFIIMQSTSTAGGKLGVAFFAVC